MAKNYFNRYVWLIDTIQQHGYITLSDLSKQWQRSALNEDGSPLPERTFFNHRDAILDTFGIEIKFDKTLGYHIPEGSGDMDGIRNWLLASLSVNNLISESAGMRDRIILENIPSGQRYLSLIIRAMKEGKKLEMRYLKFEDNKEIHIDISPLCVKVFKQRWYMLAFPASMHSTVSPRCRKPVRIFIFRRSSNRRSTSRLVSVSSMMMMFPPKPSGSRSGRSSATISARCRFIPLRKKSRRRRTGPFSNTRWLPPGTSRWNFCSTTTR